MVLKVVASINTEEAQNNMEKAVEVLAATKSSIL